MLPVEDVPILARPDAVLSVEDEPLSARRRSVGLGERARDAEGDAEEKDETGRGVEAPRGGQPRSSARFVVAV
jgi:hypothetical protein